MTGGNGDPEGVSIVPLLEKARGDIERVGWSAVGVFPTVDSPDMCFTYTIGLRELDHPEVIILGLPLHQAHGFLAEVYQRVKDGTRYADGDRVTDLMQGELPVLFRALPPDGKPLFMARNYYDVEELPALAMIWPDAKGRLPGERGCDPAIEKKQDLETARTE